MKSSGRGREPDWDRAQPSMLAQALRSQVHLVPVPGRMSVPRPYCGMGVCLECEAVVGGRVVRTCLLEGQ
jgi:hypothetical protein